MNARTAQTTAALLLGLASSTTLAQLEFTTEYGIEFSTIGDPGNRDTVPEELELFTSLEIGGVDYEYRIAVNEISVGEWLDFVIAYLPYLDESAGAATDFTGQAISIFFGFPKILSGHSPNEPTNMSFEYAARFVNWLHNDKSTERWAFESGVYDTSTFTQNEDGSRNHQLTHDPDARFWIPTLDELTKATFWDPNLNDGEGGYWRYALSQNKPPTAGLPGSPGAQTNAGNDLPLTAVGSYPNARSPWGLLDTSGGYIEHSETASSTITRSRWTRGSFAGSSSIFLELVDFHVQAAPVLSAQTGLRVASLPIERCRGDCDGSGRVEFDDLFEMLRRFHEPASSACDVDGSGTVNFSDIVATLAIFGQCEQTPGVGHAH